MHGQTLDAWRHDHVFLGDDHRRNERRTLIVVVITAVMMVAEIIAGTLFGSMALLADGWHMATHAGTLAISVAAYRFARRKADDPRFTFGTGKVGDLAAYTSAVLLGLVALFIAWESGNRLIAPVPISFRDAALVAVLGLIVNLLCAWILRDGHAHHHHGHDGHAHDHHHSKDHNLRAAYLHVLADALTSVAAILGLLAGAMYGWIWMDPLAGILGAIVIARWSWGLMRESSCVLTDRMPDRALARTIRERLEEGSDDRVYDLHLWRVGPGHAAAVIGLVSDRPQPPDHYKAKLAGLAGLSHLTVEVEPCRHGHAHEPLPGG